MFSGSIVALVTPFTIDNQIDVSALKHLIEWHIAEGSNGIVLAGTTGESATLSVAEKVLLAKTAVKIADKRIFILVGNGSNNTAESIELTKQLNNTGINGYLTITPYYNMPTDAGLIAHFSAIAAATPLPIVLYNVPSRTLCDLSNEIVLELAELINVVGIKDATADLPRMVILKSKLKEKNITNFSLLSGDDSSAVDFCLAGGNGVISVTANVAPAEVAKIQYLLQFSSLEAENSQALVEARTIDKHLASLHQALFIESNPIAVKWALFWMNKLTNANLRLPLLSLSKKSQLSLQQTLKDSGIKQYLQEY